MRMRVTVSFHHEVDVMNLNYDVHAIMDSGMDPQIAAAVLEEEILREMPEALAELVSDGRPVDIDVKPEVSA